MLTRARNRGNIELLTQIVARRPPGAMAVSGSERNWFSDRIRSERQRVPAMCFRRGERPRWSADPAANPAAGRCPRSFAKIASAIESMSCAALLSVTVPARLPSHLRASMPRHASNEDGARAIAVAAATATATAAASYSPVAARCTSDHHPCGSRALGTWWNAVAGEKLDTAIQPPRHRPIASSRSCARVNARHFPSRESRLERRELDWRAHTGALRNAATVTACL